MTNADVQTIMNRLVAMEERLIWIQKRLDKGDTQFDDLEDRIVSLEHAMVRVMAVAGLLGAGVPIALSFLLRMWG